MTGIRSTEILCLELKTEPFVFLINSSIDVSIIQPEVKLAIEYRRGFDLKTV